jgi:hypothetical protein
VDAVGTSTGREMDRHEAGPSFSFAARASRISHIARSGPNPGMGVRPAYEINDFPVSLNFFLASVSIRT